MRLPERRQDAPVARLKRVERLGRALLSRAVARLFAAPRAPLRLAEAPRILLMRLDLRLGNLILMLPMLAALRRRFPRARIDLLGAPAGQRLMALQPELDAFLPYRKRALLLRDGPFATWWRLRRARYDLCVDAANPEDASLTQAVLTRFCGARHTIGSARGPLARLYTAPRVVDAAHEIDKRLQLLGEVDDLPCPKLPRLSLPAAPSSLEAFAAARPHLVVVNVGARLRDKHLEAPSYALLATWAADLGADVILSYGQSEQALAARAQAIEPRAVLAPPTDVVELAHLMARARAVISCDTGPMHLAVASGAPTCGLFLTTLPRRFGYDVAPHCAVDLRQASLTTAQHRISDWLAHTLAPRRARHG